ncbi:hypothetical protein [Streptomyces acidiscabies]|uniref:Uncharacterized protein n=1 Tax=Streptomyces acidiscabies TaxID=42234 RepID=A0ABU4MCX0_9ACTN|nr:hypothetical protein [Streptomyces acidiscabies]MBP5938549.1 hypothetical protein [Streptomyces sp. LBUM 1476]MDX3024533.1 hypothetical protein [Streptomyces acidiscabies]
MSENLTLDGLSVPLRAVRLLALDYGHLPAPTIGMSAIYPDRLQLSLHDSPADFEVWREVLGIAPDCVAFKEYGAYVSMKACAEYVGAEVELVGYADVPAVAPVGAAA